MGKSTISRRRRGRIRELGAISCPVSGRGIKNEVGILSELTNVVLGFVGGQGGVGVIKGD